MLTYHGYRELSEDLQVQVLSLDGTYLELVRQGTRCHVELYSLYQFYVEIFFDGENGEPLYLQAFDDPQYLDPYLEQIDIAEILTIREDGY